MRRALMCLYGTAICLLGCQTTVFHSNHTIHTELTILESTDIHSNVLSYDYFKLEEDRSLGFERLATLVKQAREEFPNTLLFDDGDTIQGTALADFQAQIAPLPCTQELAMYRVMDALGYDGGTIGNHEFNYGLAFLSRATGTRFRVAGIPEQHCTGPAFPLVLANVFSTLDQKPIFPPYHIIKKNIIIINGNKEKSTLPIRIGIIGFTPPPIMQWDQQNLAGKIYTKGLVEAANEFVPQLRAEGADIVIALSHGGIDPSDYSTSMENANWHLSKVSGIDVLLLGHSHDVFPNPSNPQSRFNNMSQVDNMRGTINGIPAVMGNYWGKSLGLVQLPLIFEQGHWRIDREHSHSEVRSIKQANGDFIAPDPSIVELIKAEHTATLSYVKTPIGDSDFRIHSYFATVGDTAIVELINRAQLAYTKEYLKPNLHSLANLPLLSAASAFKTGFGGTLDYTDIPSGPLTIRNAADIYPYSNTLTVVKINGAELTAWLEKSAEIFNRIDPTQTTPQPLINSHFAAYNFDVLQGDIRYSIDISQPVGARIQNLLYRGAPINPEQLFIVVTNNYRASGGGNFPGLDGTKTVLAAPDTNRDALIQFIRNQKQLTQADFTNNHPWHFLKIHTAAPVTFISAADKFELAKAVGLKNITLLKNNGDGTATYAIDLSH